MGMTSKSVKPDRAQLRHEGRALPTSTIDSRSGWM